MTDRIETHKSLIDPIYPQDEPNQPIDLGQVDVQFEHQGAVYRKKANVVMRFLPSNSLEFAVPLEGDDSCLGMKLFCASDRNIKLTLTDTGVSFDAQYAPPGRKHAGIVFSPRRSVITVTQSAAAISVATFHLFNFPDFWSLEDYTLRTDEPPICTQKRCGRVVLKANGWIITIAATDRTAELEKELEAQGGYVVTHMGRIEREDGAPFASAELDDLLTCLHYFLSFTLGCWAGVALPVGFDENGNRVFEQWGMRKTAKGSWNGLCSWFDRQHGELFSQVLPGFMSLWDKKALWRQPLCSAVYWYLEACDCSIGVGVDTGIILAQTALEVLAWTYCVQDRKIVSSDAFKRPNALKASDKLRILTSHLGIPKEMPPELLALHGRRGGKWDDGMHAITDIRNSLIHPDSKAAISSEQYYEAYRLSLWYIARVLLRLCGHDVRQLLGSESLGRHG